MANSPIERDLVSGRVAPKSSPPGDRLTQLEQYLETALEDYGSTTQALEVCRQELTFANDEVQNLNLELGELRNELSRVNTVLKDTEDELERTRDDLAGILCGVGFPIVLVGSDLRIRCMSLEAESLFNVRESVQGRCVRGALPDFETTTIESACRAVLHTVQPSRQILCLADGSRLPVILRPSVADDRTIAGLALLVLQPTQEPKVLETAPGPHV